MFLHIYFLLVIPGSGFVPVYLPEDPDSTFLVNSQPPHIYIMGGGGKLGSTLAPVHAPAHAG